MVGKEFYKLVRAQGIRGQDGPRPTSLGETLALIALQFSDPSTNSPHAVINFVDRGLYTVAISFIRDPSNLS